MLIGMIVKVVVVVVVSLSSIGLSGMDFPPLSLPAITLDRESL